MLLENTLIAKTEVSGKIDRLHRRGQARDNLHRLPVREREKNAVDIRQIFGRVDEAELSQTVQVSMYVADRFARLLIRRHKNQLDLGMKQQNPQQLRAAVPGATKDANPNFVLIRLHLRSSAAKQELACRASTFFNTISNNSAPSRRAFAAGTLNCVLM